MLFHNRYHTLPPTVSTTVAVVQCAHQGLQESARSPSCRVVPFCRVVFLWWRRPLFVKLALPARVLGQAR